MKKSRKKTVLFFACIFVLMSCLVLASALDVGGIRAKAAETLYAAGDINGDGEVNGKDLTRLSKYIAGLNSEVINDWVDTNKDGSINGKDITHLMRYIAGEIPELSENVYHVINYYDYITGYTETTFFSESAGLAELPVLTAEGREFLGWSTKDNDVNGDYIITSIPKGSKLSYDLYACWKLKDYNITYRYKERDIDKAVFNPNESTYTMESEFEFKNPELSGLMFSHWEVTKEPATGGIEEYVDSTGAKRIRLTKGTTGDIELTANWKSYKNLVVPKTKNRNVAVNFDPEIDVYYFIYELGAIENVVLDSVANTETYNKTNSSPRTMTVSETVSVEDGRANEIINSISETVTKSSEWLTATENTKELSANVGIKITTGFEAGVEGVFAAKVGTEFGYDFGAKENWTTREEIGGGIDTGTEKREEISSTISYRKEFALTNQTTHEISSDAPNGNYYFVHAGNVKVYAFVVFDPTESSLYFDTYSILDNVHSMLLYEPAGYNEFETEALSYNINIDEIKEKVRSGYYVKYDANSGEGQMHLSVFDNTGDNQLSENQFTKPGYTHVGWKKALINEGVIYEPEAKIKVPLANPGETITMFAQWAANPYTVIYDANKPENASSEVEAIPANSDCVYDGDLILGSAPKLTGWTFEGWYTDSACTEKLGDAGEKICKPNLVEKGETTVYAKWKANTYTVTLDANGGEVDKTSFEVEYDSAYGYLPEPRLENYAFVGWKLNSQTVTESTSVATLKNHCLVAEYVRIKSTVNIRKGKDITIWDSGNHTDNIAIEMSKEELLENGYKNLKITVKFWEKGYEAIRYCKPKLKIITATNKEVYNNDFGVSADNWTLKTPSVTVSLDDMIEDCSFKLYWYTEDNSLFGERWLLGETNVIVEAVK